MGKKSTYLTASLVPTNVDKATMMKTKFVRNCTSNRCEVENSFELVRND